jgi:hypothetical protein
LAACGLDVEGIEYSGVASGAGGAAGSASGGASGGITGGAGGGGAGGAGGAVITCSPGEVEVCYTGPAGTKGVGSCKGGERTCNEEGDGFGPCVGEKTPVPEDCGTLGDDDCDGSTACSCAPAWENVFGSPGNDDIGDIATDGAGNVFIASRFNGKVMLSQNAAHTAVGKLDVLVAKIAPDGTVVWSKSFGGNDNDRPFAIAVTGTGEVVVAGLFEGVVNFGGGNVNSGGGAVFVMRLHADGSFLNMVMLDGATSEFPLDLAVDATGNAYVVGLYAGTLTASGKALSAVAGTEGFVAKVSPAAAVSWMVGVTGTGEQRASGVTVDGLGNVYITGAFDNAISMGATVHMAQGASDAYLAQLAPDTGMVKWSKAFGGPLVQAGVRVAVAATDVVVGGVFDGSITVGATTLTENGNGDDLFVARLPASGLGVPVWVKKFGSVEDDRLQGMAIELDSNVLLSGSFQGSIGFDGPGLTTKGGQDVFFARLSPVGGHVCSRSFGGVGAQVGRAVAAGAAGAAFLAGEFGGNVNFGFGAHDTPNAGDLDAFLLKLNP